MKAYIILHWSLKYTNMDDYTKMAFTLMRNLIIGNMLSLGGERVLKFSELQLNDTPHTAYGFGGLKR